MVVSLGAALRRLASVKVREIDVDSIYMLEVAGKLSDFKSWQAACHDLNAEEIEGRIGNRCRRRSAKLALVHMKARL